jgi:hypothetical protein
MNMWLRLVILKNLVTFCILQCLSTSRPLHFSTKPYITSKKDSSVKSRFEGASSMKKGVQKALNPLCK